ncbi:glycosyltransferase family 2 protein [Polynucleobacter paneuropaeus]|nr:glycosyltransferase family 2 protein [Polynucleobacter paneuropaeus]
MQPTKVIAVIVVFQPNLEILRQLILVTLQQVDQLALVNNSSDIILEKHLSDLSDCIHTINLQENMGIAYAQNIGIEWAISRKTEYVLLLDQDSMPTTGMVEALTSSLNIDLRAIAVGPQYIDKRTGIKSRFMIEHLGFPRRLLPKNKLLEVQFLISSGSLIRLDSLIKIGGMRSNYFIDHVDTEWCLRAVNYGYTLLGNANALMEHTLGDQARRVWFIYMRNISEHSPLRDYYMFRNTLLMLRDTKMKFTWKAFLLFRLIQFLIFFSLFSPTPLKRVKMMCLGIKHGFQNQRGRLDPATRYCTPILKTLLDPVSP